MEEILNNNFRRNSFLLFSILIAAICLLVRYGLLPHWNPALSRHATEIIATLVEDLFTTLVTAVLVGVFIVWVTPAIMRRANIEPIEPKGISTLLQEAAIQSTIWTFKGGMGRYTRVATLPTLVKQARKSGTRRKIRIMLIDPDNEKLCLSYALYRNGVRSSKGESPLTADLVRDQILATILTAAKVSISESLLDVELFVLPSWSVMRIDLSDLYMVMTSEDPGEPGLRADNRTHFYDTYSKDLDLQSKQGRGLPQLDSFSQIAIHEPEDLIDLMNRLGLDHSNFDLARLEKIWKLMGEKSHQYA
jgi:hypothetical protein